MRTKKSVIKAKPYLAPALEQNREKIGRIFRDNIANFISKG